MKIFSIAAAETDQKVRIIQMNASLCMQGEIWKCDKKYGRLSVYLEQAMKTCWHPH